MAEVNVTESFSLFGGYDFMWFSHMSRPADNLLFNSESVIPDTIAAIGQDHDLRTFGVRGFSFGGVFRY